MRAGRIATLVVGCLVALLALGMLASSALLGGALATQRDDDGFFTTGDRRFETTTVAITSEAIDLGTGPGPEWWAEHELARVRLRATGALGQEVFLGIGPSGAVASYLADVPHVAVADVDVAPFRVTYRDVNPGASGRPALPGEQGFWAASVSGPGEQVLTWSVEPGQWTVVVMRPDAEPGVVADIDVGARLEYLPQLVIALAVGGAVFMLLAVVLIVLSARGLSRPSPAEAAAGPPVAGAGTADSDSDTGSPVHLTGHLQPDLNRGLWLVKWFLAIPHYVVLAVLWVAYAVLTLAAFVSIATTGRYPSGIFRFNVGVLRWTWRVIFYATGVIGTDRYPPFTLEARHGDPARLDIDEPPRLSRGLVWVKSWLLALPHLVILAVLNGGGGTWDEGRGVWVGGGLLTLLVIISGVALLFTGRYPQGLFDLLMGFHRWGFRVIAYVSLMTDRYPPFRLDQGATEPGPARPLPPPTFTPARPG